MIRRAPPDVTKAPSFHNVERRCNGGWRFTLTNADLRALARSVLVETRRERAETNFINIWRLSVAGQMDKTRVIGVFVASSVLKPNLILNETEVRDEIFHIGTFSILANFKRCLIK